MENKFETPAPNAYQFSTISDKKKKGKKKHKEVCTFGLKTQKFYQPNYNPGPGTYSPPENVNDPAYTIGDSGRAQPELPVYADKFYNIPNFSRSPDIK